MYHGNLSFYVITCIIFCVSDDKYLWDIQRPFVVGISCPPPEQEVNINYIKNIRKKLWIALGQAIYIMDPQQLGIEVCNDDNRVRINPCILLHYSCMFCMRVCVHIRVYASKHVHACVYISCAYNS